MTHFNIYDNKALRWIAGIIALSAIVWHNFSIYPWMLDDAFISFRYAENFASGNGLVYNMGEQVEGYTTFLWVFMLGAGKIVGLNVVILSKVLAAVFAVGTIILILSVNRFIPGISRLEAAIGAVFLGTCGIFTPWVSSGMEVNLFSFLILLTLLLYIKAIKSNHKFLAAVGVFLALTVMTRPDGAVLVILLFGDCIYRSIKDRNLRFINLVLPAAALYLPYFIWRVTYYGYFLPNTFYAKVGYGTAQVVRGLEYLGDMVIPSILLIIFTVIGTVRIRRNGQKRGIYIFLLFIMLFTVYIVLVGGDVMPAFRFFVPIIPLLSILAAIGIVSLSNRIWLLSIMVIVVSSFNIFQSISNVNIAKKIYTDRVYIRGKEVGIWLKANLPPNTLIATNTAGSVPYYSGFRTIDMLGLNDEHIAHSDMVDPGSGMAGHEKGDGAYVLSRQPDIIQFASSLGGDKPGFPTDRELYNNPTFHEMYQLAPAYIPTLKKYAVFYIKKTMIP